MIHLSLAFGRSDLAAVRFDPIDSVIKEPGSFIHDSFLSLYADLTGGLGMYGPLGIVQQGSTVNLGWISLG